MKKILGTKLNNKGSGIVTVMVAIMFLSVFGSLLLMTSLSGFDMKVSDRKGKQNFYDAETAMGEVLTGIQDVASDSISESLKLSLPEFSEGGNKAQIKFAQGFKESIDDWYVYDKDNKKIDLVYISDLSDGRSVTGNYNPIAVANLIKNCREGLVTISVKGEDKKDPDNIVLSNGNTVKVCYDGDYEPIVEFHHSEEEGKEDIIESVSFKNITVSYESEDRKSTVITDIVVTVPDVVSDITDTGSSNIEDFVLIVGGTLKDSSENLSKSTKVLGHSYMSALNTSGSGNISFGYGAADDKQTQYKTVIRDEISVLGVDSSVDRVTFNDYSQLYAGDILLRNAAKISLLGQTNIADDLDFKGYNCTAVIRGSYTGFGDSLNDPDSSSAILFNSTSSGLDIVGANEINLYGYSFINGQYAKAIEDASGGELSSILEGSNVRMGESISVRANQAAYLIDSNNLYYLNTDETINSNPIVVADAKDVPDVEIHSTDIIPGFDVLSENDKKTYGDYNAEVQRVTMPYGNQTIAYYFIKIKTQSDANEYFSNFYKASVMNLNKKINNCVDDAERERLRQEKNDVEKYVSRYIDISRSKIGARKDLVDYDISGDWFRYYESVVDGVKSVTFELKPGSTKVRDENPLKDMFVYLTKFLTNSKPSDAELSKFNITEEKWKSASFTPYDYWIKTNEFVNSDGSKKFNGNIEFKDENGKVVAVVANGNYTYTSGSDVSLIVCNGNVTIESDSTFDGLIFCSGDLELKGAANLNCNPSKLKMAYNAKNDSGTMIGQYFNKPLFSLIDAESSSTGSSSSILSLVNYSNWRKG